MRSSRHLSDVEYEELVAQGILIVYELWGKWRGKDKFSGYAGSLLPYRLVDWWRQEMQATWQVARTSDGYKRRERDHEAVV